MRTRFERIAGHNKQERLQVKNGEPSLDELVEGVPTFRKVGEDLIEFVRHSNQRYKKVFDKLG